MPEESSSMYKCFIFITWKNSYLKHILNLCLGSRLIIRDMTGRYTWDTKLFYKGYFVPYSKQYSDSNYSETTNCTTLRPNIKVEPTSSKSILLYVLLILFFFLAFFFIYPCIRNH
jgi:hypothetical protein